VRATRLCVHETLLYVFALIIVHSGSEVLFPSNLPLSTVPLLLRSVQRQRLSLARALYGDADVYLLDDPLSALDPLLGNSVLKEVSVHVKATAAFLVPHCPLSSPTQIVENLSRKHDRRDVWQASSMEKMLIPPPTSLPCTPVLPVHGPLPHYTMYSLHHVRDCATESCPLVLC
jgi:hypothetical protein